MIVSVYPLWLSLTTFMVSLIVKVNRHFRYMDKPSRPVALLFRNKSHRKTCNNDKPFLEKIISS